ncbi:hypothetical protein LCGC14_2569060, partial [marine sediment metagenome]
FTSNNDLFTSKYKLEIQGLYIALGLILGKSA